MEPGLRDRTREGTGGSRIHPRSGAPRSETWRRRRRGRTHRRSPDGRRRSRAWRERLSRAGTRRLLPATLGSRPSPAATCARGSTDGAGTGDSRSRAGRAADDRRSGAWQTSGRARSAEQQAASLTAAEASLAQCNAARTGGATDAEGLFIVRAPVSGVIAQRNAATGANVTAGSVLFRVVDAAQVHVVGQVPEAQAARAPRAGRRNRDRRTSRSPAGRPPRERRQGAGPTVPDAAHHIRL